MFIAFHCALVFIAPLRPDSPGLLADKLAGLAQIVEAEGTQRVRVMPLAGYFFISNNGESILLALNEKLP